MSIHVKNPLFSGGHPFLLSHEGTYYIYFTAGTAPDKPGFVVYSSTDFQNRENRGYCLTADDVMGAQGFWQPRSSIIIENSR